MESAGDAESRQTKDTLETIRFNQNQADSSRPAGRRRPALRAPAEPASSQIFMVRLRGALTGLRASIGSIGVSKATPARPAVFQAMRPLTQPIPRTSPSTAVSTGRSEERREGKEWVRSCRVGWEADPSKKKKKKH